MIYYRYLSNVEFALDFLHNKCLRVSTPSQLNDPYDCLIRTAPEAYLNSPMGQQHSIKTRKDVEAYANLTRGTRDYYESHTADILEYMSPNELIPESCRVAAIEEANRQHETIRRTADKTFCILCLSRQAKNDTENATDILLWAHYANSHHGVRLAFEMPVANPALFFKREMKYRTTPHYFNGSPESLKKCLSQKGKAWSYERETRLFFPLCLCHKRKDKEGQTRDPNGSYIYLTDASDGIGKKTLLLRNITVGNFVTREQIESLKQALLSANIFSNVTLGIMRPKENSFALAYERLSYGSTRKHQ